MTQNTQLTAKDLHAFYEKAYSQDHKDVFTKYINGVDTSETNKHLKGLWDWSGKRVLDLGCGLGVTAAQLAKLGAHVHGIDFSETAIREASKQDQPNLTFSVGSLDDIKNSYDVIISLGTIEHMEDPLNAMKVFSEHINQDGHLVLTCPNLTNVKGLVLLTLYFLHDLRITLSDLHFISPTDMKSWCEESGLNLERWFSFDHSLGNGDLMLRDLKNRLPKVFAEVGEVPEKRISHLLKWLEDTKEYNEETALNGAMAMYILSKKSS